MKSIVGVLFSLVLLMPFLSEAKGLSAHRQIGESYQQAYNRNHSDSSELFTARLVTPQRAAKTIAKLDLTEIPDVGSFPDLENQFKYVRDTRFISDENFPRRLTWLYPDDGCYARAEMVSQKIIAQNFTEPKKIFVFGNLVAKTTNSSSGSVRWWYHVAVIYRVGTTAYVVDPALNPQKPMTLAEWNKAVGGGEANLQYAICSHDTFDPDADCYNPRPMSATQAESEQRGFLQDEWERLLDLNRNPEKELGDSPPWL